MKTKTKRKIDQVAEKNYSKLGKKCSLVGKGQMKRLEFLIITAFVLGVVGAVAWGFKNNLYSGSEAAGRIKNGGIATDVRAPKTPSSLIAKTISSSQINLSWSPSTDDVGVKGYNIYRSS